MQNLCENDINMKEIEVKNDQENSKDVKQNRKNICSDYLSDCLLYPVSFCICCICWCSHGCPRPKKCAQYINNVLGVF